MVETVRQKDVWEVFEGVAKITGKKGKVEFLRKFENMMPLRDVLQGTFDKNIEWKLPPGTPPYTPQVDGPPAPTSLLKQHLNFKYFIKGLAACEQLSNIRRERLFIDMLESIHPKDAEIVVSMVNKKKPDVDGLTEKLVKEAFPDLIPE